MPLINSAVNAFDYWAVDREPYTGNPDRARAPRSPFPGPGGGMGVYVSVIGTEFRTAHGHLELEATIAGVPESGFSPPYDRAYAYRAAFAVPRTLNAAAHLASWPVKGGDVIGFPGDTGYSEAPHLHYQMRRRSTGEALCPTDEPGFADGGWLAR